MRVMVETKEDAGALTVSLNGRACEAIGQQGREQVFKAAPDAVRGEGKDRIEVKAGDVDVTLTGVEVKVDRE